MVNHNAASSVLQLKFSSTPIILYRCSFGGITVPRITLTSILNLDPNIRKMYLRNKYKVCRSRHPKVGARTGQTDTETDTTENITTLLLRVVNVNSGVELWIATRMITNARDSKPPAWERKMDRGCSNLPSNSEPKIK